jgi:3-dehydroquinate synthase
MVLAGGAAAERGSRVVVRVLREIARAKLSRHSYIVGVGPERFLDAIGFAAGIANRGTRHVRIPTTALAQAGAVGLGISREGGFSSPRAVINDASFLEDLDNTAWNDAVAEAARVALAYDPELFDWMRANAGEIARRNQRQLRLMLRRCAQTRLRQSALSLDPFEHLSERPLELGQWSANAIMSRRPASFGEALSAGLALDIEYSHVTGLLAPEERNRMLECLDMLRLPSSRFATWLDPSDASRYCSAGVTLLSGIARPVESTEIDPDAVARAVETLREARQAA